MSFATDETGKIAPIDWDKDRHTMAARSAGWPTPWIDEYNAAVAAQEQAAAAAANGSTVPPDADPHSKTPNLDAWIAKCQARFAHGRAERAPDTFQPAADSLMPNLERYLHKCRRRFKHHQGT